MSVLLHIHSFFARLVVKRRLAREKDVNALRSNLLWLRNRVLQAPPLLAKRDVEMQTASGLVPVSWISCGSVTKSDVLFYVHGGGFIVGSPETHSHMVGDLCRRLGIEAVLPRYRLAPEHPFPAGFNDIVNTYEALIASGRDPSTIIIGGDSAGGGLALALLAHACKSKGSRPKCAFFLSPWTDLTLSGESLEENAKSDCILVAERTKELRDMYLAGHDPTDHAASPLFADFPNCPPVLFHIADHEILRDDTLRLQTKLVASGVSVLVRNWDCGFHVWHMMRGHFPEAKAALADIAAFVKSH